MAEQQAFDDLFLREKPARILIGLKTAKGNVYATLLSKEADCTYSHTIKILNLFKALGIVEFEKQGRIKKVVLTEQGLEVAQTLEALAKKLLNLEPSKKKPKKK